MKVSFVYKSLKEGDIVRISTKEVSGVMGKIKLIDYQHDGLILEPVNDALKEHIDNNIDYDKFLVPISDIKYIFVFNENTIKSKNTNAKTENKDTV